MSPPRATRRTAPRRGGLLRLPVVGAAVLALLACGPSTPEDVIDRETFIDAYVDLRVAALSTDSQRVAASERDSILDGMGITGDDLLRFVEVHGADLDFMRDVWNDVELRLDRPPRPTPADDAADSGEAGGTGTVEPDASEGS